MNLAIWVVTRQLTASFWITNLGIFSYLGKLLHCSIAILILYIFRHKHFHTRGVWEAQNSLATHDAVQSTCNVFSCSLCHVRPRLSHYLSQYWPPRFRLSYGITSPEWVNLLTNSGDIKWHHKTWSTFVHVMDCASGTNPLPELMLKFSGIVSR